VATVKTYAPPKHCPFCATERIAVTRITGTFYELLCENEDCERSAVISVDDAVALPGARR
jgi:hypothetical protein